MTKSILPDGKFVKFEIPGDLMRAFDKALEDCGMPRSRSLVMRQMIADFVDEVAERKKRGELID